MILIILISSLISLSSSLCCYYSEHYHNCYESVKEEGCVIGPSIFLNNFYNQPYFVLCSYDGDCPPTEMGGVFLRGFKNNCPECK